MKKTLPFNNQTDINGYLIYTYPYSILNTFPEYSDYLMENYIQCYGFINDSNDIAFEYEDGIGYNNMYYTSGPFDIFYIPYKIGLKVNIKKLIISLLNENYYPIIFTDEYYIKNRPSYKKTHFLHEMILTSYDKKTFTCFAFDKTQKLSFSSFPKKQINNAYKRGNKINIPSSTNWISEKSIIFIKPKTSRNIYEFSNEKFIEKLNLYFKGEFSSFYNSYIISKEKSYIGIYNTNLIIYCLKNPDNNIKILYPAVHSWYESKKNLLYKLKYFFSKIDNEKEKPCYNDLILDYEKKVFKKADLIRIIFLKYRQTKKINSENTIILLFELFESEKYLIGCILSLISNHL